MYLVYSSMSIRSGALSPFMAPPKRRQHQNSGRYQTKNGVWCDDFSGVICVFLYI
ncbi:hypothetical protein Hanom_Chr05g00469261 [Helianthus anomalus]